MAGLEVSTIMMFVFAGTLAAIVYSLRILILLERRISKMDANIAMISRKILKEEFKIEKLEKKLIKKNK